MEYNPLPQAFFLRDTVTVARELLGKRLVHRTPEGLCSCIITETEAYCGPSDRACHSYRGKPDGRTNVMYEPGGRSYVYLIYGMHCCFNVTTCPEGQPEAVLIRSAQPLEGQELMFARRGGSRVRSLSQRTLLTGPGRLCAAMGITRQQYGLPLWEGDLLLCQGEDVPEEAIAATPRIHVDYAGEDALLPYRFLDRRSPYLSVPFRPSKG